MKPDIRILNGDRITGMLQRLEKAGNQTAPLMAEISEAMLKGVQDNFLAGEVVWSWFGM